jgi:SecD/SecF fusion protein
VNPTLRKILKWKWEIAILAGIGICVLYLWPTLQYYRMSDGQREQLTPEQRSEYLDRIVKLGLDLQGGLYLVLEVDKSGLEENAKRDAVDRALEILRNRVDQFGVSEPVIQKQGESRIVIQLPGEEDLQRAKRLIGQTAQLELKLIKEQEDAIAVLNRLDEVLRETPGDTTAAEEAEPDSAETPAEETVAEEAPEGEAPDLPTLPGQEGETEVATSDTAGPMGTLEPEITPTLTQDPNKPFTSLLQSFYLGGFLVLERNVPKVEEYIGSPADSIPPDPRVANAMPRDLEFLWHAETQTLSDGRKARLLFLAEKQASLTGANLENAYTQPDPSNPSQLIVGFELDRVGSMKFARVTGENVGRQLAIVLDNRVRSAPNIIDKIPHGRASITGRFTDKEASDLAIVLRAGALPAPVYIEEERSVGPTLGHDSIQKGWTAMWMGFLAVVLFMIVYYRFAGSLAVLALLLNLLILIAFLAGFHAALTLPGVAGVILTIGMAVDANVLVYERIREELRQAKTTRVAIQVGFEKATKAILDANITTFIAALVLWNFGTGPVKGFATTLLIGIAASVLTCLGVTRVILNRLLTMGMKKLSV